MGKDLSSRDPMDPRVLEGEWDAVLLADADGVASAAGLDIV